MTASTSNKPVSYYQWQELLLPKPQNLRYNQRMSHAIATHIEIRPNRDGQDRAYIHGTRVRVQDVAMMAEIQGRSPDQIVEAFPQLTLSQVHAALSYYFDHRAEIQHDLKDDEELVEQLRKIRGPGVLEGRLKSVDGQQDDAVSS
jgi:uncharacterized protein (DUF433 family)